MLKQSTPWQLLFPFLCWWICMASLPLSDAKSLKGEIVEFLGRPQKYVELKNSRLKELQEFTLCIDLHPDIHPPISNAFSYDVSETEGLDFGLAAVNTELTLFHFSSKSSLGHHLAQGEWHSVCCTWNGTEMNVYVNGSTIFTKSFPLNSLKAGGSIVLGFNQPQESATGFVGRLYYFQMWDYVKAPEALQDCSEGNIISWITEFWTFIGLRPERESNLRCANESIESTSKPTGTAVDQSTEATLASNPSSTLKTLEETSSPKPVHTTSNTIETMGLTSLPVSASRPQASLTTGHGSETITSKLSPTVHSITVTKHESQPTTILSPIGTTEATSQMTLLLSSHPTSTENHFKTTTQNNILKTSASKHEETSHPNQMTSMTIPAVSATTPQVNESIESTSNPTGTTVHQSTKTTLRSNTSSTLKTLLETSSPKPVHTTKNTVETKGLIPLPVSASRPQASLTTGHGSETITSKLSPTVHSITVTKHESKPTTILSPIGTTDATSQMTLLFSSHPTSTENHFKTTKQNNILKTTASKHEETSHPNQMTSMTIPAVSATTPQAKTTGMQKTSTLQTRFTSAASMSMPSLLFTTGESSIVSFYVIRMNMTVGSKEDAEADENNTLSLTEKLLGSIFKNTEFNVLHVTVTEAMESRKLHFLMVRNGVTKSPPQNRPLRKSDYDNSWYDAKAMMEARSSDNRAEVIARIKSLALNKNYSDGHFELHIKSVDAAQIDPETCPRTTTSNEKGTYEWRETSPMKNDTLSCKKNKTQQASRLCGISLDTEKAHWKEPYLGMCLALTKLPDKIMDLWDLRITADNAEEVAEHILLLAHNRSKLSKEEAEVIIMKISEIIEKGDIDERFGNTTLRIISDLLQKAEHLREFTNRLLKITDQLGDKITLAGKSVNITAASLALAVTGRDLNMFQGVFFTVISYFKGMEPEVFMHEIPLDKVADFIFLPKSLKDHISRIISRIQFNFFGTTALFQDSTVSSSTILNTYVVGASVADKKVQNLNEPVVVTLQHIQKNEHNAPVHCVFWDFEKNNHSGGWSTIGCEIQLSKSNENYTTCHCTHLTHFGVLMDLSGEAIDPVNERILTIITYIGCGISSIFLGVALVTYVALVQLRKDNPSKILMNLCSALLLLNLMFLLNTWLSSFQSHGLCISTAALLHYFLLVSFTWMGLEAVHMYFALVKVFNVYIPNYILKFCIVGWGVPAIIVITVVIVNRDFYGSRPDSLQEFGAPAQDSDSFCWIEDNLVFYISVVTYFSIIFLTNVSMFIIVLLQINAMKSKQQKNMKSLLHDLKSTASLTFLLGLTWGFAFFAWGPVRITFLYLFAIANTLQGFFIFLFHCMMKESVRRQWRLHLCCGRFRLDHASDWSRLGKDGSKSDKHAQKSQSSPSLKYNSSHSVVNGSLSSTEDTSTWTFTKDWKGLGNAGFKAPRIAWNIKCSPESLKPRPSISESNGSSTTSDNNSARNLTNERRYDSLCCVPSIKSVGKLPSTKRVLPRREMEMNYTNTFWDSM